LLTYCLVNSTSSSSASEVNLYEFVQEAENTLSFLGSGGSTIISVRCYAERSYATASCPFVRL